MIIKVFIYLLIDKMNKKQSIINITFKNERWVTDVIGFRYGKKTYEILDLYENSIIIYVIANRNDN